MEKEMSLDQAFEIIDGVCARFNGNRQDHATLMQAMQVIRTAMVTKDQKEETAEAKK